MNKMFRNVLYLLLACVLASTTLATAHPSAAPSIIEVNPAAAPNDLDTTIIITGSGFEDGATVRLGSLALTGAQWMSATQLKAVVPWGMDPGPYTLHVMNPGGDAVDLPASFTVTAGLEVWNSTPLYGGKVVSVFYNPLDPNTIYAASDATGLFRSRDGGTHWSYIWAGSAEALAIDPLTPTRLYMHNQRSTDEGMTWTDMNTVWGKPYPHPSIAGRVYIISSDMTGETGIWRSNNYGDSWIQITTGLTDTKVAALTFHPTEPETMYAGTTEGNLFVSTNGGSSWAFVDKPLGDIGALAVNPNGSHEVWAANGCFSSPSRTIKSSDATLTAWAEVNHGIEGSINSITFAPQAWGSAYSQTVFLNGCFNKIGRSMDSGATWDAYRPNLLLNDSHHSLALHPTNPQVLYTSSSNDGVYTSADGGQTWQIANQGLTALAPGQLAVAPGQAQTVYARTVNGLYKTNTGGGDWDQLAPDLDSAIAIDPAHSNHIYAVAGTSGGWGLSISHDGGLTWPEEVFTPVSTPYSDYNASLAWKLIFQPGHPSTMLAMVNVLRFGDPWEDAGTIHYSTDSGQHWTRAVIAGQAGVDTYFNDLAFDLHDPSIAYATSDSGIFRSADSGATWQQVGQSLPALNHTGQLAVEPIAPYRVLVATYDGFHMSTDHGLTWSLAPAPMWGVLVNQFHFTTDPQPMLYAATRTGLYRSLDSGASWTRAPGALGQTPATALASERVGERTVLYVGSGGGVINLAVPTAQNQPAAGRGAQLANDTQPVNSELLNAGIYRFTSQGIQPTVLPTWEQVNQDGFGSSTNKFTSALETFNGRLYAGTWNDAGGQVWRTHDGNTWSLVTPGWANTTTRVKDFAIFNGSLYVGTYNEAGGELWRSADGATWERVVTGGFGTTANTCLEHLAVFKDNLYVAAETEQGGTSLWNSPSGNPGSWQQIAGAPGGLMRVYDGNLYVGYSQNNMAALARSANGSTWTPIFTDGLGDANAQVTALAEFDGSLYIGLLNTATGGQVWHSSNGLDWASSFKAGLGNPDNQRPLGLNASHDYLYVMITNFVTGIEVWRTSTGDTWSPVGLSGLGDSMNLMADDLNRGTAIFKNDLYLGTYNDKGAKVMRLPLAKWIYLPSIRK